MSDYIEGLICPTGLVLPIGAPPPIPATVNEGRSPEWEKLVRKIIKAHPYCAISGLRENLQVHHIKPFHLYPELELVEANLVVLNVNYHFIFGHFGDWRAWNPNVLNDIKVWHNRLTNRLYTRLP
jgi:5-methylcytosine-specific restriction enzyme A